MATYLSILAWNPRGGAWRATVRGVTELDTTKQLSTAQHILDLQCCVSFKYTTKVIQLCIYLYLLFFKFFFHLSYYRILNRIPCAV